MASPSSPLKTIQANLQHSEAATAQLRRWLGVNNTAVALIQEPWVSRGNIRGLSNLRGKLYSFTEQGAPRTCIITTCNITAQPLTEFCSRDLCAIRLQLPDTARCRDVVMASAYMPEGDSPPPNDLCRLVNHCERSDLELVVGTDSNAHHPLWGMSNINNRGKTLVEYLFTTNLNVINIGSEPTFINKRSKTIIDLTLATAGITGEISEWHVSQEASCSDHRWIRFDINVSFPPQVPRRNPRKTDRTRYKVILGDQLAKVGNLEEPREPDQVDKQVTLLSDTIVKCYHEACPVSAPPPTNIKGQPWWGPDLERLRAKVRRLLNRAMNTSADVDWDNYKSAKAKYKKQLRFKSSASWRKFCSSIETADQANRVRQILAKQGTTVLGSLKRPDGTYTSSATEAQSLLLETHFPGSRIVQNINWPVEEYMEGEDIRDMAESTITADKVRWAIKSFKPYKSAGPDGIFPALLQWGVDEIVKLLTQILRACLRLGYTPKRWREVNVVFIPKPGRSDYTNVKSYRPISLTSFMLKTMERVCEREIRDKALQHLPLHRNQHAYSSGKSTESALHSVVAKIEETLQDKGICLGTFIDIEGAFDKTHYTSIGGALKRHGVHTALVNWITNMLNKRYVRFAGDTQVAEVVRGCPQGGVLSPLLWNLVINDLITKLNAEHFCTIGYADDIAILISGKFASIVCDLTQAALRIVERWCQEYDLSVNPTKTEMVMFTNKRMLGMFTLPKLFGTKLQLAREVKYLGITLDRKLSWSTHIDNRIKKASITFWQCRRMIGKQWGLSPKITLWLYTAIIRPMFCYGSVVWWTRSNLTTMVSKLQSFQRLACMAITGCMRTTPTAALEVIIGLPPLHLYIKQEAAVTAIRLNTLQLWQKNRTPHTVILEETYKSVPLLMASNDRIPKQFVFDKKYKIQLHEDHLVEGQNLRELRIFTDGSKTKAGTGSGTFSEDLNIKIATPLGAHNTVFQAECMGIITATNAIMARGVKNTSIRILSDSMAVLQALKSNTINSGLIYECHERLTEASQYNRLTLQWIKGHSGSRGNDAADELARRGSSQKVYGPEPIIPIPFGTVRSALKDLIKHEHAAYWTNHDDCRQAKEALPSPNYRLTKTVLRLNRPRLRMVTAAITGHGSFNKHLSVLGVTDSPLCRACMGTEETAAHVLMECTEVAEYRARFLNNERNLPEVISNVKGLLGYLEELGWLE